MDGQGGWCFLASKLLMLRLCPPAKPLNRLVTLNLPNHSSFGGVYSHSIIYFFGALNRSLVAKLFSCMRV